MSSGFWQNNDGLPIQYGAQKANPHDFGDYLVYGDTRKMEFLLDLTSVGTSAQIVDLNALFPSGSNVFVENVEVVSDVASAGGTSFSVGLGYIASGASTQSITYNVESSSSSAYTKTAYTETYPVPTTISDTGFINALVNASTNTTGDRLDINQTSNSTYVGAYVGTIIPTTHLPAYVTAKASGTYTAGLMRIRIFYRGYGTIIN